MKLSDLVSYRTAVEQWHVNELTQYVNTELSKILGDVSAQDIGLACDQTDMVGMGAKITQHLNEFDKMLEQYKSDMSDIIYELEKPLIQQSYEWYDTAKEHDTHEYVKERYQNFPCIKRDKVKEHFIGRLETHADWKRSALFIRPESGEFVDPLITCTPLYIGDTHMSLFDEVKQLWTPEFQKRIRYLNIEETRDHKVHNVPENQLGLIVLYDYFNYMPLEAIEDYLIELKRYLKPGGIIVFTYNDCDYTAGVRNAENMMNTYTPGRLLKVLLEKLDFELLNQVNYPDDNVAWFEVKVPGELTSVRGGQELAQVITDPSKVI